MCTVVSVPFLADNLQWAIIRTGLSTTTIIELATMEALTKKKRIRAGHKVSATKTVRHVEELLASDTPNMERLSLFRLTLKEKFETIKGLESEVIDLTEGEDSVIAEEIEQADHYKKTILAY